MFTYLYSHVYEHQHIIYKLTAKLNLQELLARRQQANLALAWLNPDFHFMSKNQNEHHCHSNVNIDRHELLMIWVQTTVTNISVQFNIYSLTYRLRRQNVMLFLFSLTPHWC